MSTLPQQSEAIDRDRHWSDANGTSDDAAFDRVWERLQVIEEVLARELATDLIDSAGVTTGLETLSHAIAEADRRHREAVAYSAALSTAQAEALVRSAEIIEELERTKSELSEARRIAQRQQEERLRVLGNVFESLLEGVAILDADARLQEFNPAFLKLTGSSEGEVLGQDLPTLLDWTFPEYSLVLRDVMNGSAWTGRVCVTHPDRQVRSYLVSFSPVSRDSESSSSIVMFSDVTEIDRTQQRLTQQALHDLLTGLPNRRFFRERIQSFIDCSQQSRSAFAVCFIDLDDFKHVNDSLGHVAGDELLKVVSARLLAEAGDDVFVARFGGDEFALLIPNTDADLTRTSTVADRVLKALREPIVLGDNEACIGASIGVTEYPTHCRDIDQLLQNADVAMYAAKNSGRNQVRVFSPEMRRRVEQRLQIHGELQRALRGNEISLQYQPQVSLETGEFVSCEALARWRTPDGRDISPSEFVPVAEQTGLVVPLGELVLITACHQMAEWEAAGCRPPHVAVNISPHQLHARSFPQRLAAILAETGVEPEWIMLEITENAVMKDVQHAIRTMDELVDMGFAVAIDDFGTGHSSLSYLKQFNIHTLKVDRSFVMDLGTDERVLSIVKTIIHLGQGRDLQVVAEGIETRAQYDLLRNLGCHIGQGYYISRPLRPEEFMAWALNSVAVAD